MKWPWVSRGQLEMSESALEREVDARKSEVEWYRGRIEALEELLERRSRFEAGMSEKPRPERTHEIKPMPDELKKFIAQWADPKLRKNMEGHAYRRHTRGEKWESIMLDVTGDQGSGQ